MKEASTKKEMFVPSKRELNKYKSLEGGAGGAGVGGSNNAP